jgi:hypothetical protein
LNLELRAVVGLHRSQSSSASRVTTGLSRLQRERMEKKQRKALRAVA